MGALGVEAEVGLEAVGNPGDEVGALGVEAGALGVEAGALGVETGALGVETEVGLEAVVPFRGVVGLEIAGSCCWLT